MKEAIPNAKPGSAVDVSLDMNDEHKIHVLYSGTSLISCSDATSTMTAAGQDNAAPRSPTGGVIVYVLRTGFSSSQGSLMQMIEFSAQSVSSDSKDTGFALLLLMLFALVASAYVLKEGLRKGEKTQHELLLRCVIIITSVVPRQLPMQMAMAVNMALMALMKCSIYCTEPFRVPLSGKVSHCLFDKTGTLTTDQVLFL
jgi:cation-transporting ATPase 13A1